MSNQHPNNYPKLHNAAWPGVVGKGEGGEPPIDLDTMLDLTAAAEVDGVKFDGFDLFLYLPHIDIDSSVESDDAITDLAEKAQSRNLQIGTVVAPIWPPTGGGAAMGDESERAKFLGQVRKGCYVGKRLRELGVRPHGAIRIDSAYTHAYYARGNVWRELGDRDKASADFNQYLNLASPDDPLRVEVEEHLRQIRAQM